MQDIEVICSKCGHRFAVLGILEGDRAVCPGCLELCDVPGPSATRGGQAAPPAGEAAAPPPPRKQARPAAVAPKPTASPEPKKPAPQPAPDQPPKTSKAPALLAIGAAVIVGLGALFHFGRSEAPPKVAPAPPPVKAVAPAPAVEMPPEPEPVVVEAPAAAESPERAEMRRIATLMLQRYPLAQPGEELTLTLRNGMVYEGIFLSVDDRFVVIERDGDPVQLAVNTLVPAARARIDNEFRFQLIKDLVRVSLARHGENP